jgi:hypothetical protein
MKIPNVRVTTPRRLTAGSFQSVEHEVYQLVETVRDSECVSGCTAPRFVTTDGEDCPATEARSAHLAEKLDSSVPIQAVIADSGLAPKTSIRIPCCPSLSIAIDALFRYSRRSSKVELIKTRTRLPTFAAATKIIAEQDQLQPKQSTTSLRPAGFSGEANVNRRE